MPVFRKLLDDAKQQKDPLELTSEQLPEISVGSGRVGADGVPPLSGKDIMIPQNPYP